MKSFTTAILLTTLLSSCTAFMPASSLSSSQSRFAVQLEASTRRSFFTDTAAALLIAGSVTLASPQPALAEKEVIPATRENVKAAFDALRYELNGAEGGVARMQKAIDSENWEVLLDITRSYDLELRKKSIGAAKKFLPKGEKTITTMSANAITFDLIGMNRNARPGQENAKEANRYLDELRTDLKLVIAEEKFAEYED